MQIFAADLRGQGEVRVFQKPLSKTSNFLLLAASFIGKTETMMKICRQTKSAIKSLQNLNILPRLFHF